MDPRNVCRRQGVWGGGFHACTRGVQPPHAPHPQSRDNEGWASVGQRGNMENVCLPPHPTHKLQPATPPDPNMQTRPMLSPTSPPHLCYCCCWYCPPHAPPAFVAATAPSRPLLSPTSPPHLCYCCCCYFPPACPRHPPLLLLLPLLACCATRSIVLPAPGVGEQVQVGGHGQLADCREVTDRPRACTRQGQGRGGGFRATSLNQAGSRGVEGV